LGNERRGVRGVSFLALVGLWAVAVRGEVQLSSDEFKRLDTFEAHVLGKADEVFVAKDYKRAAAEYDSFILEFPRSTVIPYALLRKARCLQLLDKRYEAIKEYNEVLDYFPNAVKYAAAALYYIGLCHWESGDEDEAMKAWAKMAEDEDYSKHPLAAWAINRLADYLAASEQSERAAEYYEQVASDFRRSNPAAAYYAIEKVIEHCVRHSPDEPRLRAFYKKVGGFGRRGRRMEENPEESRDYWEAVRRAVRRYGRFGEQEAALRERYYHYWANAMRGRFPQWDDYQIDVANFTLANDGDVAKWVRTLDQQFRRHQRPGDYDRVLRWMRLFRDHKARWMEYYKLLDFSKMSNRQIRDLMSFLYDDVHDEAMARNAFEKLRLDEMSDAQKASLARYFYHKNPKLVRDLCMMFQDKELGLAELLRFYHWARDTKDGVAVADELAKVPRFAREAHFKKGQLLAWAKRYREAIAAFQRADNPPDNLWAIADCYARMGRLAEAVRQLREVEAFFKDHAPEAALRIARLYKSAGKDKLYVAALRAVMKKYPKSRQSSEAHQHLERLGARIGGGVEAEE